MRRLAALPVAVATTLALAACGGSTEPSTASAGSTPTPTPTASARPTPAGTPTSLEDALAQAKARYVEASVPPNTPKVTGAPGTAPKVAKPTGPKPTKMVIKDLAPGKGAAVPINGTATFHYTGVDWDTGKVFDSSWQRGKAQPFPLPNLIPGWQIGIPGMREGARRELVIPPELAYGPAGSGSELAGKTLVFVIDVVKATG